MVGQIGEIALAVFESIFAAKICSIQDKKADADSLAELDESEFIRIEEQVKEQYGKEQLQNYIAQNPILPNHNCPIISEQAKAGFIDSFFDKHPDLKYNGREETSRCLGQHIDKINEFLDDMLSAEGKIIIQQINSSSNSITNRIQDSQRNIISAIKDTVSSQNEKKEPIHYHISKKNNLFFGRAQIINDILQKLRKENLVFLTGAGGMGKSQIAQEIVSQLQGKYELMMWFPANTEMELLNEFNTAAIANKLVDGKKDNFDRIASILSAFIGQFSASLIIYDGADDISIEFLTAKCFFAHSDIIITTQNSNVDPDEFSVIPIDTFTPKEAESFLMTHSKKRKQTKKDAQIASDLCNVLEYYPLALEYARAYVNKTQNSFEEYMQIYREHKYDILDTPVSKYKKTAYTAWKISYDKVVQQSSATKHILNIVSFLDTHDIPLHDIFALTGQYSEYELNAAILTIKNYSLFSTNNEFANIHGITQEFIRLQMQKDCEYQNYYGKTLHILSGLMPDKITNASEKELAARIIKHAIKLISYNCNINDEDTLNFASNIAAKLYISGSYRQTSEFIQEQIEKYASLGENIHIFQMITFLAQTYHYTGNDSKSLELLEQYSSAVSSSRELADEQKGKLLSRYKNVEGIIQKDQKKYSDSLKTFAQSLELMEELCSEPDLEIKCNILMNIGIVHKCLEEYNDALEYYKQAQTYSNHEKHLLSRIYGNMAIIYMESGQPESAFQYLMDCLDFSRELGEQRNECICLNHLGNYYADLQQYDKAKRHLEQSLKIAEKINFRKGIANASGDLEKLALFQQSCTTDKAEN